MTTPLISAALAAFILVLQVGLMLTVGLHRGKTNVVIGVSDDKDLERKIRRHGNLAENAGLFIAAFAVSELVGGRPVLFLVAAGLFAVARLSHAVSFSSLSGSHLVNGFGLFPAMRMVGAFGTFIAAVLLAVTLLGASSVLF
ncbi:MAG: MAPEG family protein [Pseudomonadota bacterium]